MPSPSQQSRKVPEVRVISNGKPIRCDGDYVLYWQVAARRTRYNPALARAIELCHHSKRPLLVLEPLRLNYRWACDRFHQFLLEGMASQSQAYQRAGVTYYPYIERSVGEGAGLLEALATDAVAVVTDLYPCFFLPQMQKAAESRLDLRFERIDGNGLLPLASTEGIHKTAYSFRRFLQRNLPSHLEDRAVAEPLCSLPPSEGATVPPAIMARWTPATTEELSCPSLVISALDLDHGVPAVELRGGETRVGPVLDQFLEQRFPRYASARNSPEDPVTSGLSPWLHFGHLSSVEIFDRVVALEEWTSDSLAKVAKGSRSGWWGMSPPAEAFLDQLITWRELSWHLCWKEPQYDRFSSLPTWARETLETHAPDRREPVYTFEEFDQARTEDPLWNAAQNQLRREGLIHNYLRMLWGKKVLHWSPSPESAFQTLVELNNRYALDGRDPNSYSAIGWIFGRFDRAWGPERKIFGKVRYMSSENTARKVRVRGYIQKHSA